jgi:hypothetical protein
LNNYTGWLQVGLAAVAIIVAVALFLADRRKKSLSYAVLSNRAIVTTPTNFDLEVLHRGDRVANPWLLVLRIANGGASPVELSDYEQPIRIRVDGARILSGEIAFTRPDGFRPCISNQSADALTLDPSLINSGDLLEIQMLLDGRPEHLRVEARLSGISTIGKEKVPSTSWGEPWKFNRFDSLVIILIGLAIGALGIFFYVQGLYLAVRLLGLAIAFYGLVIYPWQTFRAHRRNRLFLSRE